eukprot:TRINITY_DN2718_c0_g1_i1.p1 TRINITY_DN2718_c0_g1~~TRINITY_DN2718_c0_g1_i1.p1  ORF type:complete len:342 (+),score=76.68 TRINITY_DN2718_c0_g1_i1:36-1028(+)
MPLPVESTAPFLSHAAFALEENGSPFMEMNLGYIESQGELIFGQTKDWPALLGVDEAAVVPLPGVPENALGPDVERIIEKDVERTFKEDAHRKNLQRLLRALAHEFNAYAQALCYVCALLRLTHDEATTAAMARKLNADPKYLASFRIDGELVQPYWSTEAVAFATDAYVFLPLLEKHVPEVHALLSRNCIFPETYLQKWWVALCIQVLPFRLLIPHYFRRFLTHGQIYLFQFGLALHKHFQSHLLGAKGVPELFAILRFEKSFLEKNPITEELFDSALQYDLSGLDSAAAREHAYNTHLKARLERARKLREEQEEDDDDLLDEEDEDDE